MAGLVDIGEVEDTENMPGEYRHHASVVWRTGSQRFSLHGRC